jgi:hypothetical protein
MQRPAPNKPAGQELRGTLGVSGEAMLYGATALVNSRSSQPAVLLRVPWSGLRLQDWHPRARGKPLWPVVFYGLFVWDSIKPTL